ncbi:MAG: TonB-dependent receptor [Calditrichaeota bacterium]|nr:MAG: TonB-dependent receptor [Calditrichota bacterium]
MKNLLLRLLLLLSLLISTAFAQQGSRKPKMRITGKIVDSSSKTPLEYANVVLYNKSDSLQVTGTTTDEKGEFRILASSGEYFIEVFFIGYEEKKVGIPSNKSPITLGDIPLKNIAVFSDEVQIEAERSPVTSHIDKKVVNVSSQITSTSGNATDVLENVPSVAVDIDGNVSLRGSENFRVLIDGVPSVLESSEALQQIPASTIDRIEIITNPSVKYAPDGDSGIINIILKKGELSGTSGVVNLDGGTNKSHGADFLINYRKKNYQFFLGADYKNNKRPGSVTNINRTTENGVNSYINSDGSSARNRKSMGVNLGTRINLTSNDILSLSTKIGNRSFGRASSLDYEQYSDLSENRLYYQSEDEFKRSGNFYSVSTDYKHEFQKKGHEISAQFVYNRRNADEQSTNELTDANNKIIDGQISNEIDDPTTSIETRLDYILPITEEGRLEIGTQTRFRLSEEETDLSVYDTLQTAYILQDGSVRHTEYDQNIRSVYGLYANSGEKLGYQFGVRAEYTGRNISVEEDNSEFKINRWDFFPTAHFSYEFSKKSSFMTSYTRRIERPRGWYLEPFETWTDSYNVRRGNPSLKPENIDSFEMGYQTFIGNSSFSSEIYYRTSGNKIERVRSVYGENITLLSFANVGRDHSLGAEFMLNTGFASWWDVNFMLNLFNYRVKGELDGVSFDRNSNSWSSQVNNTFKISKDIRFQLNSNYRSSTASAQGKNKGTLTFNSALKYNIIPKKLTATLQAKDIFGSSKRESTTEGPGFYEFSSHDRDSPTILLNLSLNLNNYKPERNKRRDGGDDGGEF